MSGDQAEAVAPEEPKLAPNTGNAGKGRPKGSLNRHNAILKDAILLAAQRAGGDGEEGIANYLEIQARENPGPFLSLLGKVLPMTVSGDPNAPVEIVARIERVLVK